MPLVLRVGFRDGIFSLLMNRVFISILLAAITSTVVAVDWNQWRGNDRNGVVKDGIPLLK